MGHSTTSQAFEDNGAGLCWHCGKTEREHVIMGAEAAGHRAADEYRLTGRPGITPALESGYRLLWQGAYWRRMAEYCEIERHRLAEEEIFQRIVWDAPVDHVLSVFSSAVAMAPGVPSSLTFFPAIEVRP